MIQRIQTIYLLAVVALALALIWLPAIIFVSAEDAETLRIWELGATGLTEVTETELPPIALQGVWGLTLTTVLIPVLALIDIFLYKKRILMTVEDVVWSPDFWAAIPLICMVLTLMATRRILKDEALVRAADRIR